MPWALRENLILSGFPKPEHLDKYGWKNVGMITLCAKAPSNELIIDGRIQWWMHMPIADGRVKDVDKIWEARNTAITMLSMGCTTIIHCMAGRNRSGLIGALVLQHFENLSGPEALERVRELRPRSVDNIHFEEFLMNLGRPR